MLEDDLFSEKKASVSEKMGKDLGYANHQVCKQFVDLGLASSK